MRPLRRALGRRERVEKEVGIAALDGGFDERHVVVARLGEAADRVEGLDARDDRDVGAGERGRDALGHLGGIHRARQVGNQQGRREALGDAARRQEPPRGLPVATQERRALPASPDTGREEGLERHRALAEARADQDGIERGREPLAHLLAGERLLLGLPDEEPDPGAGGGQRVLLPPRRALGEPDVERPRCERRLGVRVVGHLDEHEALDAVAHDRPGRVEHDAPRPALGDPEGPRAHEQGPAVRPRRRADDAEAWVGEHGQQRSVGLNQDHLERAGIRGLKLLDHSGQPPEERRPHDVGVRGVGSIGKPQALEAREHVAGAERRPVVEGDVLAEGEGPREAVGRDGPPRREARLELRASPVVTDEGVEDLTRDERGRARDRRRGVERGGNGRKADPHFAPPVRGTRRDQKRHEPQEGDEEDEPGRAAVAGPHASLIYEESAGGATPFRRPPAARAAFRGTDLAP